VSRPTRFALLLSAIAVLYFAAAKLGLALAFVTPQVTAVWPPTGIALASLILFGLRAWPAVWIGALLANAPVSPLPVAIGIATGNTLEAVVGAWLLGRFGFQPSLDAIRHVSSLLGPGALVSTTVSATIGLSSLCLGGVQPWSEFGRIWVVWWLGDAMSVLVVAPLLLVWSRWPPRSWSRARIAEGIALFGGLVVALALIFGPRVVPESRPLHYLMFPFVIAAAVRFGQPAIAVVNAVASATAIWGTAAGAGPFGGGDVAQGVVQAQLFLAVIAVTGLILAGAISERKHAEDEREQMFARERAARSEAELANRAKDEFLAMLGHELRNPLAAITNATSVLERIASDDRFASARAIIARQAAHLSLLVDDLLDVARVQSGRVELQREAVDLGQLVERCAETLATAEHARDRELCISTASVRVDGDPARLEQIVTNLLGNALKYTPAGGHVWVEVRPERGRALVCVRDDGIGISRDLQPRVFDLFVQADRSLDGSKGGLGLGLTLVKRLVELHGGTVAVHSAGLGQGSEFTVELPLAPTEARRRADLEPKAGGGNSIS
jgi:signal transduction histidine kinase